MHGTPRSEENHVAAAVQIWAQVAARLGPGNRTQASRVIEEMGRGEFATVIGTLRPIQGSAATPASVSFRWYGTELFYSVRPN